MKIDEKWSIVFDENNAILRFEESRKKVKNNEDFTFREDFYYPTLHTALVAYLHKSLEPAEDAKDCVRRIDEAIEKINKSRCQ